ncbi:MAG: CBS domain-containing protein [Ulvibacter sp.]|jgi:CBS domain-containing protein
MNVLDPIATIMTKNVLTIGAKDKLQEAQKIFDHHRVHHIPVVSDGAVLGILSLTDLLYFLKGKSEDSYEDVLNEVRLKNYTVEEIMSTGLANITSTDQIYTALNIFKENLFHAMPVIDDDKLVGVISTQDIINALANQKTTPTGRYTKR